MDADRQDLACDVCGRLVRGAFDDDRLSYCASCQRFVCGICWVPGRDICRLCLHPGQVVAARLRPRITETFVASTAVQPRPARPSAGRPPVGAVQRQAPPPRRRRQPAPAPRHGRLWPAVVAVAAVGTLAVGAALVTSLGPDGSIGVTQSPSPSREAVLSGVSSTAPSTVPTDPPPTSGSYLVEPGDTLRGIARAVYGDELQWRRIYDANRAAIPDEDQLSVGQVLVIPRP